MNNLTSVLILIFFSIIACTPTKQITYKTSDIDSRRDSISVDKILAIQLFEDERSSIASNDTLFQNKRIYENEHGKFCINSEKNYSSEKIPLQVSKALEMHFFETRIFRRVRSGTDNGDFILTGKITRLFGKQGFSKSAATGAQFGLIGALATAGIKTDGLIRITLSDLKLTEKSSGIVYKLDQIDMQFEGEFKVDGYCWSIYENVNQKLKEAIDSRLVPSIISVLRNTPVSTNPG